MHPLLKKLTIAIPVHNDAKYIAATVQSCLNEAGTVRIYDNASTDGTSEICAEFATKFPHVKHIRRTENMGAFENFKQGLFECETEYFNWVGSHDQLGENYSLPLLEAIEKDKDIALVTGIIQHIGEEGEHLKARTLSDWVNETKDMTSLKRVGVFVAKLRDCFMMHGLQRVSFARDAWFDTPCLGFDRALLHRIAARGKIAFNPESIFYARAFNLSRDNKNDQNRRSEVIGAKPVPKNLFLRNKSMIDTVLSLATTPEELSEALKIIDKINRRFQNRRHFQKLRLIQIAVGIIVFLIIVT